MLRFSILPAAVVALNATRSTEASRPILNGVHLAPDGTMTATDGHVLLTWRNAATFDNDGAPVAVVSAKLAEDFSMRDLPNTLLAEGYVLEITPAVLKLAKLRKCERLSLTIDGARATWNAVTTTGYSDEFAATLARVIEGPFPQYKNVFPREVPEIAGQVPALNAEYVGRFALAAGQTSAVALTSTGAGRAVLVNFPGNPDAFGIVMPLRPECTREVPAWVLPAAPAAVEETAAVA